MCVLDNIKRNIANLRFAIEFDTHDFTQTQQAMLLLKLNELTQIVDKVESEQVELSRVMEHKNVQ